MEITLSSYENIYITGHSLGGALAQHFVSTMLMGNQYGPVGQGDATPESLKAWPWSTVKLVTFGSPRAGDKVWAKRLTEGFLESDFFSHPLLAVDHNALRGDDMVIPARLLNSKRAAAFRVLISTDPITTEKIGGGKHVGKTVYVDGKFGILPTINIDSSVHELTAIRSYLLAESESAVRDGPWQYLDTLSLVPSWKGSDKGSVKGVNKIIFGLNQYYQSVGVEVEVGKYKSSYFDLIVEEK